MWNSAHDTSKPRLIDVNRPVSEAVPNDPDSDFDDPAPLPPKKRVKKESKPTKYTPKPVPRISACGWKNLDSLFVAQTRDGTAYRLAADEDNLDENEFMGLFASGPYDRADPGVCDAIITWLDADKRYNVIVVDASERGLNFARLAAGVAMLKWARACKAKDEAAFLRNASRNAQLPKPTDAKWKDALRGCARGRSWAEVREHAREWYLSL